MHFKMVDFKSNFKTNKINYECQMVKFKLDQIHWQWTFKRDFDLPFLVQFNVLLLWVLIFNFSFQDSYNKN